MPSSRTRVVPSKRSPSCAAASSWRSRRSLCRTGPSSHSSPSHSRSRSSSSSPPGTLRAGSVSSIRSSSQSPNARLATALSAFRRRATPSGWERSGRVSSLPLRFEVDRVAHVERVRRVRDNASPLRSAATRAARRIGAPGGCRPAPRGGTARSPRPARRRAPRREARPRCRSPPLRDHVQPIEPLRTGQRDADGLPLVFVDRRRPPVAEGSTPAPPDLLDRWGTAPAERCAPAPRPTPAPGSRPAHRPRPHAPRESTGGPEKLREAVERLVEPRGVAPGAQQVEPFRSCDRTAAPHGRRPDRRRAAAGRSSRTRASPSGRTSRAGSGSPRAPPRGPRSLTRPSNGESSVTRSATGSSELSGCACHSRPCNQAPSLRRRRSSSSRSASRHDRVSVSGQTRSGRSQRRCVPTRPATAILPTDGKHLKRAGAESPQPPPRMTLPCLRALRTSGRARAGARCARSRAGRTGAGSRSSA